MDEPVELQAPLPGGALSARLTFKGDRAVLEEELTGPRSRKRKMDRAEADAYLAEVGRMHADADRRDEARRASVEAARAERAAIAAAGISMDCGRCGIPRTFEGRHNLLSAGEPENVAALGDHMQRLQPRSRAYYEYACPRCGSVEWLRHGPLDHPVREAGG